MPSTVIRFLLNHFRWDKEKFMEWFYDNDGDQEKFFTEAHHIMSPFAKAVVSPPGPSDADCQASFP